VTILAGVFCAAALVACGASAPTTTVTIYQAASTQGSSSTTTGPRTTTNPAALTTTTATTGAQPTPITLGRAGRTTATIAAAAGVAPRSGSLPLSGKVVGIDPGHNGGNFNDPSYINRLIWNGREMEPCNTTGTETDSGYTEAQFNFNVATYLAADLQTEAARVVMTRHSNTGVGPCVNQRAHIIDSSGAEVAIDIHADGGPPNGRGFAILEPVADGLNDRIIHASDQFGKDVIERYQALTGMPTSTYDGTAGVAFRDDLAGLNLTTVPEVLIETGNMRNATDAAMLTSRRFQQVAAKALAQAITLYLTGRV
jgi:N-acetylmuramoyl-L-alanine amidase